MSGVIKRSSIKSIFFDIDGTLIDMYTKRMSEKTLEALQKLKKELFNPIVYEHKNKAFIINNCAKNQWNLMGCYGKIGKQFL